MQKNRNFAKTVEDLFQQNDCTEFTTDEWTSLDDSGTHLTSLAEFSSSPFQEGWNEIHFIELDVSFQKNKTDNN